MVLKKFTWPAELTLTLIGGKWKGLILNLLLTGEPRRFGELKRLSTGISAKILAKQLKELEYDGLITRMVLGKEKPRIVYAPTQRSRTLEPILSAIQQWGADHLTAYGPEAAPGSATEGVHAIIDEPNDEAVGTGDLGLETGWGLRETASPTTSSSHSVVA
ncbi:MAG: helix-turn-helix transcriptional regulator [Fibrobacterota bacterium]|nr:helix-turn-helix transcriptional regulator [Fibrobacterota bacterium]